MGTVVQKLIGNGSPLVAILNGSMLPERTKVVAAGNGFVASIAHAPPTEFGDLGVVLRGAVKLEDVVGQWILLSHAVSPSLGLVSVHSHRP